MNSSIPAFIEEEKFRNFVREFAESEIKPYAKEIDKNAKFNEEIIKKLGKVGLLGIPFPKEYGGLGYDNIRYAIGVEEISRVCGSTGLIVAAHTSLGTFPIYQFGTQKQKEKYLPHLTKGEFLGAFGLTEPNAGSDAAATRTYAKLENDKYVVNGTKVFITSGSIAGICIFTAVTDREKGAKGITAFIVEKGTPGFYPGKEEEKLGVRGSITSELIFENCHIPKENILGNEGEGFKIFMRTLDGGRVSIAAMALGIAQAALDESIKFLKSNNLLQKNQSIQKMIADITTEVTAARLLVYNAAYLEDQNKKFTKESAIAKLFASKVAVTSCNLAMQIIGIDGYTQNFPVERFLRDAKLTEIGEGTSEIQRIVIAREMLK
jgi:butyryl-CoA dehydrogenase